MKLSITLTKNEVKQIVIEKLQGQYPNITFNFDSSASYSTDYGKFEFDDELQELELAKFKAAEEDIFDLFNELTSNLPDQERTNKLSELNGYYRNICNYRA